MKKRNARWRRPLALCLILAALALVSHPGATPQLRAASTPAHLGEAAHAPRRLAPPVPQPSLEQMLLLLGVMQRQGG